VATLLGPLVLGMPYLTMLERDPYRCFRAGKTGEFGYDLLVPKESVGVMRERLAEIGGPLEMKNVSLAALDLCALENWHFSMRNVAEAVEKHALTPIELQLQSRVGYDRTFVGAEAVRTRRARGAHVRATSFMAPVELAKGQSILLGDQVVGEIVNVGFSPSRNQWVGIALLSTKIAHPHIELVVKKGEENVTIRTATPPLLNNRSLHVDPHRHSFRTRGVDTFPSLVVS
jgi:glycine cleavage system aminomethyltransferase T